MTTIKEIQIDLYACRKADFQRLVEAIDTICSKIQKDLKPEKAQLVEKLVLYVLPHNENRF